MTPSQLLGREDLQPVVKAARRSCRLSRRWCSYVRLNIKRHGEIRGNHVSGVYNEQWPEHVKNRLRVVAYAVGDYSSKAYAARPAGVHVSTIRKVCAAVANRYGSGYYGFRG